MVDIKDKSDIDIIDFAVWYSGMDIEKVKRAYNRYLKEKEDAKSYQGK